jgi:hypothetical protein
VAICLYCRLRVNFSRRLPILSLHSDFPNELRTTPVIIAILPIRQSRVLQPAIRPIVDGIAPRQIRVMRERVTTPIELCERSARIGAILERVGNDTRDVARYVVGAVFAEVLGSVPGLDDGLAGGIGGWTGIRQGGDLGWDGSYEGTGDYVNCVSRFVRYGVCTWWISLLWHHRGTRPRPRG